MQALGLIETRGLVAAVESADAMLKAADVTLLEKVFVGGGLVSIAVTGEVAAVKAAVDAGAAAVRQINSSLLISEHVIPRPHEELDDVMVSVTVLKNQVTETEKPAKAEVPVKVKAESLIKAEIKPETVVAQPVLVKVKAPKSVPAPELISSEKETEEPTKKAIDKMVTEKGLEEALEALKKLKVIKLRNLARGYKNFGIVGRLISKADKQMLLAEFKAYYEKNKK